MTQSQRAYVAPLLKTSHRNDDDRARAPQIARLSTHHLHMMDFILSNPLMPLGEVATALGRTQAWVSTIYHSDLFQALYQERRAILLQNHNEMLAARLNSMVHKGLDKLTDALDDEETPLANRQQITELGLKAIGVLGQKGNPVANVQVNVQNNNNGALIERSEMQLAVQEARQRILARQTALPSASTVLEGIAETKTTGD